MHIQKSFSISRRFVSLLSVVFVLTAVVGTVGLVHADQYEAQINALNNQNGQNRAAVNGLLSEASSYEQAIGALQSQISGLQAALNGNLNRQADVQRQITEAQTKLDQQRNYLGENVKTMYIEGQLSTIEQLATSKTLSDFVDKEEYRTRVQNKIDSIIKQIAVLQGELQKQKRELDVLVSAQREQNNQLVSARAQQQQLLTYNQQQQNGFTQRIAANNAEIIKLKQAQAAESARRFGSGGGTAGGGGYPWGNAVCIHTGKVSGACPNYDWAINGSIWNYANGGYGYRNCTDYVAWRIGAPAGLGNANSWPSNAQAKYGIPSSSTPQAGDAAVDQSGTYGHVMYVESVSADGIVVSDYNRTGDGLYRGGTSLTKVSEGVYRSSTGVSTRLTFVHF